MTQPHFSQDSLPIKMTPLVLFFTMFVLNEKDKSVIIVPFFLGINPHWVWVEKRWAKIRQVWVMASVQWDGRGIRKNSRRGVRRSGFGSHLQIFCFLISHHWTLLAFSSWGWVPLVFITTWFYLLTLWLLWACFLICKVGLMAHTLPILLDGKDQWKNQK